MKTLRLRYLLIFFLAFTLGCQKEGQDTSFMKVKKSTETTHAGTDCSAYVITLMSKTYVNGKWEWVWSIQNSNPAAAPDLSYWGMQFGECFNVNDIYEADWGCICGQWTSFTPTYAVDPNQKCVTSPVLKFPKGVTGTNRTYYRLVLNKDYSINPKAAGYSKSVCGCCCNLTFCGVGCPPENKDWCSFSQGYWFSRPKTSWCQGVVFGTNTYTQAQGKEIWKNAPSNSAVKHAFTQASTLQLSMICKNGGEPIPADIIGSYNTIVSFLSDLTYNDILTGSYPTSDYNDLNAAAGAIGDWIDTHHCPEEGD